VLYRGVFGTQKPGGRRPTPPSTLRSRNIANTHVVRLGDKLLALWEASSPHRSIRHPDNQRPRLMEGTLAEGEAFSAILASIRAPNGVRAWSPSGSNRGPAVNGAADGVHAAPPNS